jgi:ketosteroid isomerase-like protein
MPQIFFDLNLFVSYENEIRGFEINIQNFKNMLRYLLKLIIIVGISGAFIQCSNPNSGKGKQEILNTDKAFSELSKAKGMKHAFLEYAAENAVILRENSFPQVGKNAMVERFNSFSDTGFILTWEPKFADVAASDDLGYSYGIYSSTSKDSFGQPVVEKGTYVSVWKKVNDGKWKFVLDTGNEGLGEQD